MKKLLFKFMLAAALLSPLAAFAQESNVFYSKSNLGSFWKVYGIVPLNRDLNPRCYFATELKGDGELRLNIDLIDQELYLQLLTPLVTFNAAEDKVAFVVFEGDKIPKGAAKFSMDLQVHGNHNLIVRNLSPHFIDFYASALKMTFYFSGGRLPFQISLKGSTGTVRLMEDCISVYNEANKPSIETVPSSIQKKPGNPT